MSPKRRESLFLVAITAANLLFDLALIVVLYLIEPPGHRFPTARIEFFGLVMGVLFMQLGVMAIWTALATWPSNLQRIAFTTLVLAIGGQCIIWLLLGFPISSPSRVQDQTIMMMYGTFFTDLSFYYFVQAPMWLFRGIRGSRLMLPSSTDTASLAAGPLRLKHILGTMAFIAVPLTLMQPRVFGNEFDGMAQMCVGFGLIFILFNAAFVWTFFRERWLVLRIVALLAIGELLYQAGTYYFCARSSIPPSVWPEIVGLFRGLQGAAVFIAVANGLAGRWFGYRLFASNGAEPEHASP